MPNTYNIGASRKRRTAARRPMRRAVMRFRKRYRRRRQYIPRTITPDTKLCRLRYCFTQTMEPGSGATDNIIVRANDLYPGYRCF